MTLLILWKEKNQLLGPKNEVEDGSVFLELLSQAETQASNWTLSGDKSLAATQKEELTGNFSAVHKYRPGF